MKKFLLYTFFISNIYTIFAQDINDITGHYLSYNGDLLTMRWDGTFRRVTGTNVVTGTFKIEDNKLLIEKPNDKYYLHFVVGTTNLVITQPRSNKAWLFRKIRNE